MKVLVVLAEDQVARLDQLVRELRQSDPGASRSRLIRDAINAYILAERGVRR